MSNDRRRLAGTVLKEYTRFDLDLSGLSVVTEAATGPYASTAVLAALAGATVTALTRDSRYGSATQAAQEVLELAREVNCRDRIEVVEQLSGTHWQNADIVTNSGHLRPLDSSIISQLKSSAVISLMYESWELRHTDLDVCECRRRGIRVVGTNERHPIVAVFEYLGPLVLKCVLNAGRSLVDERCLVLSDNDFGPYIEFSLLSNKVHVTLARHVDANTPKDWDIVVIACTPPAAGGRRVNLCGLRAELFCQVWGDVERATGQGEWCPVTPPSAGHMGLLLSELGPSPVARLQAAGLKAAEAAFRTQRQKFEGLCQWVP